MPNRTTYGDLEYDALTRQVKVRGVPVALLPKHRYLFLTMLWHPERCFTREELMDYVYGEGSDTNGRMIDTYLSRVRRTFARITGTNYILKVSGRGYKLAIPGQEPPYTTPKREIERRKLKTAARVL